MACYTSWTEKYNRQIELKTNDNIKYWSHDTQTFALKSVQKKNSYEIVDIFKKKKQVYGVQYSSVEGFDLLRMSCDSGSVWYLHVIIPPSDGKTTCTFTTTCTVNKAEVRVLTHESKICLNSKINGNLKILFKFLTGWMTRKKEKRTEINSC